jgi:hypothetical protein
MPISDDSRSALYAMANKNKQARLAGMSGATQAETAGLVEGVLKSDAASKTAKERIVIGERNAAEQIALRREEIAGGRAEAQAALNQQGEQWGTTMNINTRRYDEQMKDMKQQRLIGEVTTGVSAAGTIAGAQYKNTWGDAIRSWFSGFLPKSTSVTPTSNYTQSSNPNLGIKKPVLGSY